MRAALVSDDARKFYEHQRSIGTIWSVVLPPWEELSFEDKALWEDELNQQIQRDKEHSDYRHQH